jgi:glycolate oxidase FAD binding subunit
MFYANDKTAGTFSPLGPQLTRIHKELKRQFDPAGIFNPGRLYPDL